MLLVCLVASGTMACAAHQVRTGSSVAAPDGAPAERAMQVRLHGKPLTLHLAQPNVAVDPRVLVLYASGDGGWFGTAVDMFHEIVRAGYATVGFSSRAFLHIERPRGGTLDPRQLAAGSMVIGGQFGYRSRKSNGEQE